MHTQGAVAHVAAALNDADRSLIGDPRGGTYAVSLITNDLNEATLLAKHLASLGLEVRTNIRHDENGEPIRAYVTLYKADDQRRLFEVTEQRLSPDRRQRLKDLVLARGPVPDDILEKIRLSAERRRRPDQIANRMNELGVIAGMGGIHWTAKKVRAALAEQQRRASQRLEAA